jgi:hypothetical protein
VSPMGCLCAAVAVTAAVSDLLIRRTGRTVWDCPLLATCWVGLPVLSARIGRWLPAWQQCQQQWSTGDCSAQEGGQRWAHDDRGDPSGGQLVTDTALRRRRCSVMQPCGSRVEEGTRRCKHR